MDHDPASSRNHENRSRADLSDSPQKKRCVSSVELLQGKRELQIEHAGDIYRLRITKAGKLILTK